MDEKGVLNYLNNISQEIDHASSFLHQNDWDNAAKKLTQIENLQEQIRNNNIPVDTMLNRNPTFKKEYEAIKEVLQGKIKEIISVIQDWRNKQLEKIADSKNVLDNLSKYSKNPSSSSYYIDRKE